LTRVYIDTSVVVALSSPDDEFHGRTIGFLNSLRDCAIPSSIGPPFILEMAKAAEKRGVQAASRLADAVQAYEVELTRTYGESLWSLSRDYASLGVLGESRTLDLMHYASATLLGCTHVASWDRRHFNDRVEKRVNRVNASKSLATLKVGDPVAVERYLGIA
jgi:predicted nucleic acid-binding protein